MQHSTLLLKICVSAFRRGRTCLFLFLNLEPTLTLIYNFYFALLLKAAFLNYVAIWFKACRSHAEDVHKIPLDGLSTVIRLECKILWDRTNN